MMFAVAHDYRLQRADRGYMCAVEIEIGAGWAAGDAKTARPPRSTDIKRRGGQIRPSLAFRLATRLRNNDMAHDARLHRRFPTPEKFLFQHVMSKPNAQRTMLGAKRWARSPWLYIGQLHSWKTGTCKLHVIWCFLV